MNTWPTFQPLELQFAAQWLAGLVGARRRPDKLGLVKHFLSFVNYQTFINNLDFTTGSGSSW